MCAELETLGSTFETHKGEEALAARMADGDDIPEGHQRGPSLVRLPALTVLQAELSARETGITRAEPRLG